MIKNIRWMKIKLVFILNSFLSSKRHGCKVKDSKILFSILPFIYIKQRTSLTFLKVLGLVSRE